MLCRGDTPRYEPNDLTAGDYPTPLDLKLEAACPNIYDEPHAACESIPEGCFDPR